MRAGPGEGVSPPALRVPLATRTIVVDASGFALGYTEQVASNHASCLLAGIKHRLQAPDNTIGSAKPALPNGHHMPSSPPKEASNSSVASPIPTNLLFPKLLVRLGEFCPLAVRMTVPEASVNEDRSLCGRDNEVWCTRQCLDVPPVADVYLLQQTRQPILWAGEASLHK